MLSIFLQSNRGVCGPSSSSITTVSIIEKSFFVRAFGDKMRIFKNPTRDEFLALGKIYKELLVADIMKK